MSRLIFSGNMVDEGQITHANPTTNFGVDKLHSYRLSKVFRTTDLTTSFPIYLNDTRPINFIALVDHNLSLTGTWGYDLDYPYFIPDPHFLNQNAWYWQETEGTATFLGGKKGGVRLDGSGSFWLDDDYVIGAGYYNPLKLPLETDFDVVVEATQHSVGGVCDMYFGPTVLIDGTPGTYKRLSDGTTSFTVRTQVSDTAPLLLDGIRFRPSGTMDITIHSVRMTQNGNQATQAETLNLDRLYPLGANPWENVVAAGKVPAWVKERHVLVTYYFFDPVNTGKVTINVTDTSNHYGFIQLARIVVGYGVQPNIGVDYSWNEVNKSLSKKYRNPISGELTTNKGGEYRAMRMNVPNLTQAEAWEWEQAFYYIGQSNDCVIIPFPEETAHESRRPIYGILNSDHGVRARAYDDFSAELRVDGIGGTRYGLT